MNAIFMGQSFVKPIVCALHHRLFLLGYNTALRVKETSNTKESYGRKWVMNLSIKQISKRKK